MIRRAGLLGVLLCWIFSGVAFADAAAVEENRFQTFAKLLELQQAATDHRDEARVKLAYEIIAAIGGKEGLVGQDENGCSVNLAEKAIQFLRGRVIKRPQDRPAMDALVSLHEKTGDILMGYLTGKDDFQRPDPDVGIVAIGGIKSIIEKPPSPTDLKCIVRELIDGVIRPESTDEAIGIAAFDLLTHKNVMEDSSLLKEVLNIAAEIAGSDNERKLSQKALSVTAILGGQLLKEKRAVSDKDYRLVVEILRDVDEGSKDKELATTALSQFLKNSMVDLLKTATALNAKTAAGAVAADGTSPEETPEEGETAPLAGPYLVTDLPSASRLGVTAPASGRSATKLQSAGQLRAATNNVPFDPQRHGGRRVFRTNLTDFPKPDPGAKKAAGATRAAGAVQLKTAGD